MSELRSGLRRVRDGLPEPTTGLDDILDLARRRHRTRRVGTAVFAFALFAGAATGAWLAFRGSGGGQPAGPDGALFSVDLGTPIADAAVGSGALWVTLDGGSRPDGEPHAVVQMDPTTGEVLSRTTIHEAGAIATGEDSVWVTGNRGSVVVRIDPATGGVEELLELPEPRDGIEAAPDVRNDIAVVDGRVWVSTTMGGYGAIDIATNEYDEGASYFGAFGQDEVRAISASPGGGSFWMAVGGDDPHVIQVETGSGRGIGPSMVFTQHPARSLVATDRWVWLTAGYTGYPLCDLARSGDEFACGALLRFDPGASSPELQPVLATGSQPSIVVADDVAAYLVDDQGELVRVDAETLVTARIASVGRGAKVVAVADGLVYVADGSTLAGFDASRAPATVEPEPTATASPEPTGTGEPAPAGRVPERACAFPAYIPTYLPWLGSTEGTRLARPDMSRTYEGGGPQGLDPGYSMVTWSADEGRFGVTLWRATQSAGDGGSDPEVPALPDGSPGRFYLNEGDESIAIIWNDAIPETHDDGCGETTLVVGWSGASDAELRTEAKKVAESLRPYDWEETWPPSSDDGAFAVWPVDTPEEAVAEGGLRADDPSIVALTFGVQVLGWPGCRVVAEHPVKTLEGQAPVTHMILEVERDPQGPTVEVEVAELLPGQWFVTAVYGTKVTVSVTHDGTDWTLEVTYDGPDVAGGMVDVRVGYGTDGREAANRAIMDGSGTGSVTVDLGGLQTNMPGNVVILFYDASGAYVAQAFALAPGETTVSAG